MTSADGFLEQIRCAVDRDMPTFELRALLIELKIRRSEQATSWRQGYQKMTEYGILHRRITFIQIELERRDGFI